jgi:hypothetical protein
MSTGVVPVSCCSSASVISFVDLSSSSFNESLYSSSCLHLRHSCPGRLVQKHLGQTILYSGLLNNGNVSGVADEGKLVVEGGELLLKEGHL